MRGTTVLAPQTSGSAVRVGPYFFTMGANITICYTTSHGGCVVVIGVVICGPTSFVVPDLPASVPTYIDFFGYCLASVLNVDAASIRVGGTWCANITNATVMFRDPVQSIVQGHLRLNMTFTCGGVFSVCYFVSGGG